MSSNPRTEDFMRARAVLSRSATLTALLFLSACGDNPAGSGIEPQITNQTDAFTYQVSDLDNVSGTYTYTWQNTGTAAKITHSSDAGATGTATLTVHDADGTLLYTGQLASTGEPVTAPAGIAGAWTIRIIYADYSNTQVNFGVLKE